jgi:hypothetical protein
VGQDIRLEPHPYQDYSGDAFMVADGRWAAYGWPESDRGCPLMTVPYRPMWHVSRTTSKPLVW